MTGTRAQLSRLPMRLYQEFTGLSTTLQFVIAGGLVMTAGMFAVGRFISTVLTREVVHDTAIVTALLLDSIISPLAQDLPETGRLAPPAIERLDAVLQDPAFRDRFPYLEIWRPDGEVVYSNTAELIGQRFDKPGGLIKALNGEISAQYADLAAREHVIRSIGHRYLEIYSPVREHSTGRIIGVAEIHEVTAPLAERVGQSRRLGWAVVAGTTVLMMASLFSIVHRAGRTIRRQQQALESRMIELERASETNLRLRERIQRASSRAAELNESYLKRIGADLHDGPSQLVGAATLKLEAVKRARDETARNVQIGTIAQTLKDALRELREIAQGLMLPEIAHLTLSEIVARAIAAHTAKTGIEAAFSYGGPPATLSHVLDICVYRFVQEGLMNTFWHGTGVGIRVDCRLAGTVLTLAVSDEAAPGRSARRLSEGDGLGLRGLRHRVESLGGTLNLTAAPATGSRLEMVLDLQEVPSDE